MLGVDKVGGGCSVAANVVKGVSEAVVEWGFGESAGEEVVTVGILCVFLWEVFAKNGILGCGPCFETLTLLKILERPNIEDVPRSDLKLKCYADSL